MAAEWAIFLPALCLYPVWIEVGLRENLFQTISTYYPMMLAMIIGSMIAGSTPLGGGVVAFPIAVLVFGLNPTHGRDFSLLIQSVGMSASSFLILYKKQHLLVGCGDMICKLIFMSIIGLIVGFELLAVSPYVTNIVYTTTVACIVFVFTYQDFTENKTDSFRRDKQSHNVESGIARETSERAMGSDLEDDTRCSQQSCEEGDRCTVLSNICLVAFAITGGLLSSQIGTGADIFSYLYGKLANEMVPSDNGKLGENSLTAMSVIIMASTSVCGSVIRLSAQQDSENVVSTEVLSMLFACSPVVVLGAPVGSLFLVKRNQKRLRYAFYILGILQLLIFGAIKIGNDVKAWSAIVAVMFSVLCCLVLHFRFSRSGRSEERVPE